MGLELTHSQALVRLNEISTEITRLNEKGEAGTLTNEDEKLFAELVRDFDDTDEHRKKLERAADTERLRSALERQAADSVNGGGSGGGKVKTVPGSIHPVNTSSLGSGYDRDAILEPDSIEDHRFRNPWDMSEVRVYGRSGGELREELRARALSCIEKMPSATDSIREAGTKILEDFDDTKSTIARLVLGTSSPSYMRAFGKMSTGKGHSLTPEETKAMDAVEDLRAMSLTPSAGGYLVPFQLDPTVIVTAAGSRNDIRRIAEQVVATGNVWNGVSAGAVSWSWDAEASQVSDDAPTFAQPTIPIYMARGFVPVSIEALEDMANGASAIAKLLAFGRDVLEAAAFATGTGTGQPTGVVTALVAASTPIVNSATTDVLAVADLYNVQGALPARYRSNANWLATNAFYNRARQFDTAGGSSLWAQLADDRPPLLLGKGVYEAEDMDGVINATQENYMAVFGDFSNYVIADRIGMTVEFIPQLFQQTTAGSGFGRPTGQRGWFAYYRTGATVVNPGGFKLLDVT
jgi:HK97 family phage major capsid protein